MLITINFERNVYKYLVIKLASMDLSTALHKKCWKGALIFSFLAHKYSLLRFGSNFAVKLPFQTAHFNTVRNLKFNYN